MRSVGGPPQLQQPSPSTSFWFQQHHYQQQLPQSPSSPGFQQQQQQQQHHAQSGPQHAQHAQPFVSFQQYGIPFNGNRLNNINNNPNMVPTPFQQYQHQQQQQQQQQQQGGGTGMGGPLQGGQMQGQGLHQQGQNNGSNNGGSQGSDGSGNGGLPGQQGFGPASTGAGSGNGAPQPPEYTLAGILHFLQSEWRRYERDRNEWEIERAEMRARIALLEGERRGAENLKTDLMRRVKMLEFALRQERSKYLAQNTAAASGNAGSPGQTMTGGTGTGTPAGGPPGGLAKHPLVQGVTADKASSSGRSSPVARSEDFGKDGFAAAAATFQGQPRGPSNLSTNSFTASSLTFGGTGGNVAGSTLLFNPAGAGSTMSFSSANAPNASMLSRHTSLARDGKSRAKSRDYLKQCLSEISYLTNPATLNPLNERTYINGAVSVPPGSTGPQAFGNGGPSGALGLAPLGAGAASAPGGPPSTGAAAPLAMPPGSILRPRKVMYEDAAAGTSGGAPPALPPPPPPPPSLPTQSLPAAAAAQGNGAGAGTGAPAAPGFVAQGGGLDRPAASGAAADPGLPELGNGNGNGAGAGAGADPLGATSQPVGTLASASSSEAGSAGPESGAAPAVPAPVEDAAELMPAPSPSGATPVVPDVPAPESGEAPGAGDDASSSSSSSTDGEDDRRSEGSSASSSTTVEEEEAQQAADGSKGGDAPIAPTQQLEGEVTTQNQLFEQRSGGAASRPDRMSHDSAGRPLSLRTGGAEDEVEREIEDEVDEDEPIEEQRTAIYRPGGVPPASGGLADASADDWRRLREAGAQQRQRRERERRMREAAENEQEQEQQRQRQSSDDPLADVRAHLAETTERVNALRASSEGAGGPGSGSGGVGGRPPLLRTSSGRADEEELANLKLDPVPDEDAASSGPATRRRARAGSALSAATSSEPVADTQPWKAKRVLRGHLDAVRAVAFDTVEASVLSAGDDCTIKYWRFDPAALQTAGGHGARDGSFSSLRSGFGSIGGGAAGGAGGSSAADYPIVTFRGHTEPVTCLAVSPPLRSPTVGNEGSASGVGARRIYSGSLDATIRVWPAPSAGFVEAYPPVENTLELGTLVGHTDAVWDLALFSHLSLLVSVAADGMVKVWSTESEGGNAAPASSPSGADGEAQDADTSTQTPASVGTLNLSWNYFGLDAEDSPAVEAEKAAFLAQAEAAAKEHGGTVRNGGLPVPTSVDMCHSNIRLCAVGYTNGVVKLFDVTTGKETTKLQADDAKDASEDPQVNCVASHPTLPILFTAHESGHIRMFDLNTGACTMSMVGHLDSVTTLDIDPAGLTLVSGGHDCSVRFWDIMGGGLTPGNGGSGQTDGANAGSSGNDEEGKPLAAATAAATAAAAVSVRDACVQEITSHRKKAEEGVLGVRYSTGAPFFASAGADGVVRLFG